MNYKIQALLSGSASMETKEKTKKLTHSVSKECDLDM